MARRELRDVRLVLGEARSALRMTQREFGEATRASHRSAVRWDAGQATPGDGQLRALAALLHPVSRALAVEVAEHAGETLESLGLEVPPPQLPSPPAPLPPPPPPPPPAAPALRADDLVDVVILAAVRATGSTPEEVRPWLHAVFKRAHEIGLSPETAELVLRPAPATPAPEAPGSRPPGRGETRRRPPASTLNPAR